MNHIVTNMGRSARGAYRLPGGESPVFFEGAELSDVAVYGMASLDPAAPGRAGN